MNINRHNYESFFLLYVDNELSAADKKTVDAFVQENPDLAAELLLLQQTIIDNSTIVFDAKDLLLKDEFALLQEKLLLYGDSELTKYEVKQMESLVQHDVTAAAEWNILQQTRLQPNLSVVFPDKKLLYKTESGRVIVTRWWRIAAAAVLLGFGLWTGVASYKKYFTGPAGSVASAKTNPVQVPHTNSKDKNTTVPLSPENNDPGTASNSANETITVSTQKNDPLQEPVKKLNKPAEKTVTVDQNNKQLQENFTSALRDNKKPNNNLPKSYLENINNKERNEITANNVSPKNETVVNNPGINNSLIQPDASVKTNNTMIADNNPNAKDPKNTVAIPVVYNKTADNNDRYLDTDEDNAKRTKVGGFFRKVKRLIERNTNIKTGNELKVAGFEIAIK